MDSIFPEYSFPALAVAIVAIAALVLLTRNPKWNDYLAFGVIFTAILTTWIVLHPRQTPLMDDAKMVQKMIGAGKPVLLEFQSPY